MAVPLILIRLGSREAPVVVGIGKATVSDAAAASVIVSNVPAATAMISDADASVVTVSDDP